jgi:uncharacterized lipoprotein YddW (UPF0748 family)
MKKFCILITLLLVVGPITAMPAGSSQVPLYGLWLHPGDAGHNEAQVAAFIEKAHDAHINTIVLLVKGAGTLYFPSKLFPEAVAPEYRKFDLLRAVIKEAHKRGLQLHAWLTDFTENANGYAYTQHPGWAELNPDGKTTLSESLGHGRSYPYVWMCPAQRPGYTDQYLLPLIKEIVTNYDVDGIHHDYVRYPGDVNPDGYCFCDYCLNHIFSHSHLVYETVPHVAPLERRLPRVDADLSREYTVKPPHWDEWTRREKANFLLHGRYQYNSASDMSYFFYTYRTDAIKKFAQEAYELVKGIRPSAVISAAVFKNPMTSGRFIGQWWTDWTQYVDEFMPMTYRAHFSVDWPTFLKEFGEYTCYQKRWVQKSELDQGIATGDLYREIQDPINNMDEAIDNWLARKGPGGSEREQILADSEITLSQLPSGQCKQEYEAALQALPQTIVSAAQTESVERIKKLNGQLLRTPPPGFFPPERLLAAIRIASENGADGIVFFAGGTIEREHLWGAVKEGFSIISHERHSTNVAALR